MTPQFGPMCIDTVGHKKNWILLGSKPPSQKGLILNPICHAPLGPDRFMGVGTLGFDVTLHLVGVFVIV